MILHHFTALEYLEEIMTSGLTRGDVPISPDLGKNAVWFTTDSNPSGHGLTDGRPLTDFEKSVLLKQSGRKVSPDARFPDKRKVKIDVVIPSSDKKLKKWLPWARKHLQRDWLEILTRVGGGKPKARTWYIYNGVVRPELFRSVSVRDDAGIYRPYSAADVPTPSEA